MDLLVRILAECWFMLAAMAPYLLLGFLVAGLLSAFVKPSFVEEHLGRPGLKQVAKASMLGVPLPLCSCGVIPVAASLRRHGASQGATVSFLTSTPQTGVDSIMVTWGLLGPLFTLFRVVISFVSGLVCGGAVDALAREGEDEEPAPPACPCCAETHGGRIRHALAYGFLTLPRDIGRALLVGIVISGLLSVAIPPDALHSSLRGGPLAMLAAMAIGIPMYVCSTGSVPIAVAMLKMGVSPGAALVFLITGPATNAATFTTLWKVLGRRATVVYLASIALCALVAGILMDRLLPVADIEEHIHGHAALSPFQHLVGVALLGLLVVARYARPGGAGEDEAEKPDLLFAIEGMRCSRCVEAVTNALRSCAGVEDAKVDLKGKTASVFGRNMEQAELVREVEALGFGVRSEEQQAEG
jgi:uncharacterized membrane protein YraQ (UPF0718 family)/copper chaperone CopZ